MKIAVFTLSLILVVTACSPSRAQSLNITAEPNPLQTTSPAIISTLRPSSIATLGPTDLFITQVIATKYAAQTQYAAIPTITPTPTIPPDSPACVPDDLQTTFASNGATGRIALEVGVTNIGDTPCFLPSWPKVQLLDHSGKTLDIVNDYVYLNANPSSLPPTQSSNPGEPLVYGMEVDQTAGLFLLWGNWCQGAVSGGVVIRVSLLGDNVWVDIPTDIEGGGRCDDATSPSTIEVAGFGY